MIFNVTGGGAGSGGTLVVTAPAGVTCTVSKDGKTKSKTVDQYGYATFKGLDTGTWKVTITDGFQTSPEWEVNVVADYAVTVNFFSATIVVTYPEGSTCTCHDGTTTLTAPDTSGSCTFVVPNAGTWTVICTNGDSTDSQAVTITTNGESQSVALGYTLWLYKDGVFHDTYTMSGALVHYKQNQYIGEREADVTNDGKNLTIKTNKVGATWSGYATDGKIDMSKYSTLKINITSVTWGLAESWKGGLSIATAREGNLTDANIAELDLGKNITGELTLDISAANEEAYIVICLPDMGATNSISFDELCLCM